MFAPPEHTIHGTPFSPHRLNSPYDAWGEVAQKLENETFRAEFALDLVEVFFQIVHTRLPLLNPAEFRSRLGLQQSLSQQPSGSSQSYEPPLHPALVATVLAWGAKFSEHDLLNADRKQRPENQSHFAKTLIDRARDLAEALKVHRVPSTEHVVISLLIEPLQSQNPDDPNGYHGFWLTSATRHLLALNINHKSKLADIQEPENRGTIVFAWWMTCLCDAYASAYYRRKPILDDEDYDIDFYTAGPVSAEGGGPEGQPPGPSPREQLEFLGYYRAAHSLARTARQMSRQLWKPSVDSDGVPFETLTYFSSELSKWRDQYLTSVGVPANYAGTWDFVSAVSSCASDATYHVMWIILFNALDDFGVRELNGNPSPPTNYAEIQEAKRKVADEALHGALRIAGLAGVLTTNGYLRLDPAVMHVSCIQAGTFLARLGRPEVANCIAGLEQYSWSYEEAGEQAKEMRRLYEAVAGGENELNHMDSVTHRVAVTPPAQQQGQGSGAMQGQMSTMENQQQQSHGSMGTMQEPSPGHSNGNGYSTQNNAYSIYGR